MVSCASSMQRGEVAVISKWKEIMDDQSLSYGKVPSSDILCRTAGFRSMREYCPTWRMILMILPPESLAKEVLGCARYVM